MEAKTERLIQISKLEADDSEHIVYQFRPPSRDMRNGIYLISSLVLLCPDSITFRFREGQLLESSGYGDFQQGISELLVETLDEYMIKLVEPYGDGRFRIEWTPA